MFLGSIRILECVFGFWDVFYFGLLQGFFGFSDRSVLDSEKCFWILEVFLESGKYFGFYEEFLDSERRFGLWKVLLDSGTCFKFWDVLCPYEPPYVCDWLKKIFFAA